MPDVDEKSVLVAGSPCTEPWSNIGCVTDQHDYMSFMFMWLHITQDYSSYGRHDRESGKTFVFLMVLSAGLIPQQHCAL